MTIENPACPGENIYFAPPDQSFPLGGPRGRPPGTPGQRQLLGRWFVDRMALAEPEDDSSEHMPSSTSFSLANRHTHTHTHAHTDTHRTIIHTHHTQIAHEFTPNSHTPIL